MRTICFIEPPYNIFMESLDAPFTLMYLAAVAENEGWQASILDMDTLDDSIPEANVYAVSSSSPQWPVTVKLSRILKERFPDSMTLVGGSHVSAEPNDVWKTDFSHGVIGEGDITLSEILSQYPDDDWLRLIPGKTVQNLDNVPFPARHLVDWNKYKRGIYQHHTLLAKAVSIISSRGCPHNCCFCGSNLVFGHKTRFRSVTNVVQEIAQVIHNLGFTGFNFHDDTFCLDRLRVFKLSEAFTPLDVVWRCLTRANTVDAEMLNMMYLGGCREIVLGAESGNQTVLNNLQKGTTVKQNLNAMKLIIDSGIQLKTGIIVGAPGETWKTVKDTEKMLRKYPPDFWNVNVFTPYPGSQVWRNPDKYKIKILTRDLSQFYMVGNEFRGNVVVETEEMSKADIEQARDYLIDVCMEISGPPFLGDVK